MLSDVAAFLDWFEGVHRRTVRDIALLPQAAETWRPEPTDEGPEAGWGVPELVPHLAESRRYFAGAFLGRGWVWDTWRNDLRTMETWIPALEESMKELRAELGGAGPELLEAKIELIADPGRAVSGWRILMMMTEHEIAHRAQIGAYAGLNGWPVAQLFDRTNEWVRAQRDDELKRRGRVINEQ